jgi:signal transduction histidine kinase
VADDGPGFEPSPRHTSTGLQNMHDRLGALDARLSVVSAPGEGTVVSGSIPLEDRSTGASRLPADLSSA